ncbi:MAG: TonB-dependent receptor [Desulfobacterales bacterium]|nr:TonB-dependent receptor [Desulfobacterales bacterium]
MKYKLLAWSVATIMTFGLVLNGFAKDKAADEDKKEIEAVNQENVTVIGTRTAVDIAKYPGSVNVVTEEDLKEHVSVVEALSDVTGFETGGGYGRNIGQQFTIRGFGNGTEERVIIKQDGIRRSPTLFSGMISSFRTDPDILKRVEVVKGSSSIAHGGGAIGGVVGMTTKDAFDYLETDQTFGVNVFTRYETNDHAALGTALYGAPENSRFDWLLYGKIANTGDLERAEGRSSVDNDEDVKTGFVKLGFTPAEDHRFTTSFFNFNEKVDGPWNTLRTLEYHDDGPVRGELDQKDLVATYSYHPQNNNLVHFDMNVFYAEASYDRRADYTSLDLLIDYENEEKVYGTNIKNLFTLNTGPLVHRLLLGVDYMRVEEDASYVRNGVVTVFGSMPNSYDDYGIYIQNETPFFDERFILYLGGRYDRFERSVDNKNIEHEDSRFSPRVGAAFEVFNGLTLLANYSEAFRAPTPHETSSEGPLNIRYWYLPNTDLEPETSKETEFGFTYDRQDLMQGDASLWFRALYFIGDIENMIDFKSLPELGPSPDGTIYGTYENVESASREGFEIEGRFDWKRLRLKGSYEHLDLYDDATDEKVPHAFADKLMVGVEYDHTPQNLRLGLEVNHWFDPDQNPESYVFRGTTYYYVDESFTIANFRLRWDPDNTGISFVDNGVELHAGVENIFDKDYINAKNTTTTSRTGKGRNIYFNLSKKF